MPAHHFGASSSFQISQPATRPLKCAAACPTKEAKSATADGVRGGLAGAPMTTKTGLTPMLARSATGPSNWPGVLEVNMKKRAVLAPESLTFCRSLPEKGRERFMPASGAACAAPGSARATRQRRSGGRSRVIVLVIGGGVVRLGEGGLGSFPPT